MRCKAFRVLKSKGAKVLSGFLAVGCVSVEFLASALGDFSSLVHVGPP